MSMIHRMKLFLAIAVAGSVIAGIAQAQVLTLKLGHVDRQESHSGVGVDAFAAEVAKRSDGTMKIEVFHGGKLGNIPTEIARALATSPRFIFLDEPVSALDVSIQAQILNLLKELQERFRLTYLIVANNLNVEGFIPDRLAIMRAGRIVEIGKTSDLFRNPQHKITKDLLASILSFDETGAGAAAANPDSGSP